MSLKIDKIQVLERIKGYYNLKTNAKFASFLGIAPTTLSSWYSRSTFDLDVIYSKCAELSMNWILTGYGPILLNGSDSKISKEHTTGSTSKVTPISPSEESIIYKMYKEKDSEVGALKEEIGGLKERIRQLESQNKEAEHHSRVDKALETFTSDLSGDYGEGFSPTNQPTTSKNLSVGKT